MMATAVGPCATRRSRARRKASARTGRPVAPSASETAPPTPETTSTLAKPPPAPVIRMTIATAGRAEPTTSATAFNGQPRRTPSTHEQSSTSSSNATKGDPTTASVGRSHPLGGKAMVAIEPDRIRPIGSRISATMVAADGGSTGASSSSAASGWSPAELGGCAGSMPRVSHMARPAPKTAVTSTTGAAQRMSRPRST